MYMVDDTRLSSVIFLLHLSKPHIPDTVVVCASLSALSGTAAQNQLAHEHHFLGHTLPRQHL